MAHDSPCFTKLRSFTHTHTPLYETAEKLWTHGKGVYAETNKNQGPLQVDQGDGRACRQHALKGTECLPACLKGKASNDLLLVECVL